MQLSHGRNRRIAKLIVCGIRPSSWAFRRTIASCQRLNNKPWHHGNNLAFVYEPIITLATREADHLNSAKRRNYSTKR